MTPDREREGIDRLRVGGWLPPARLRAGREAVPAHAAPDGADGEEHDEYEEYDEPERRESPTPYEAPPVDLDEPVSAPRRRAAGKGRNLDAGAAVAAGVGRYVYQGRRRLGEMVAPGPARQRAWLALAGIAVLALAVVAVATLSPDGGDRGDGAGVAGPTAPQLPPPSAGQGIGSASPDAPPSPSPSRTQPRSRSAPAPPPGSRPGPVTMSYEAEHAALIGGARVQTLAQASGGRIVQNIGSEPGRRSGLISFTEVDVPATTRYALTIHYVSGEERTAVLTINTSTSIRLSFPSSGGWDVVGSRTFTIELVGGRNNLLFSNRDDSAPGLDRINLLG